MYESALNRCYSNVLPALRPFHRLQGWTGCNGENLDSTLAPSFLIGSSSFLQVTRTIIKAWMGSNLGKIPPLTSELAALERLKKMSYNLVSTLAPSFLIRSSSYLQVTRTSIISRMSLNFSQIRPQTVELVALEHLKKFP